MKPSSLPSPTISPTNRPSNERAIQIRTRIEGEGGTSATLLDDFCLGQSKALAWLTFEDSMQLDPKKIRFRKDTFCNTRRTMVCIV